MGLVKLALDATLDSIKIRRPCFGDNHPSTAESMFSLSQDLYLAGYYDDPSAIIQPADDFERERQAKLLADQKEEEEQRIMALKKAQEEQDKDNASIHTSTSKKSSRSNKSKNSKGTLGTNYSKSASKTSQVSKTSNNTGANGTTNSKKS